jgi:hypothetical protein
MNKKLKYIVNKMKPLNLHLIVFTKGEKKDKKKAKLNFLGFKENVKHVTVILFQCA